jgi:large subunit ribosomal protein L24
MKILKGDTVLIISGKDRGKKGKILTSFPKKGKVIVEGMNLKKKHRRPRKSGEKGQIVQLPGLIDVSNVKIICPKCGRPARIGSKTMEKRRYRICKKCGQEI